MKTYRKQAKTIRCFNCNNPITDNKIIHDKYHNCWCETCAKTYLEHCDKCNALCEKESLEYTEDGGKYCEECITYCVHCSKAIPLDEAVDAVQSNQHDTWCKECAEKFLVKCAGCDILYPAEEMTEIKHNHYCKNCKKIIESPEEND